MHFFFFITSGFIDFMIINKLVSSDKHMYKSTAGADVSKTFLMLSFAFLSLFFLQLLIMITTKYTSDIWSNSFKGQHILTMNGQSLGVRFNSPGFPTSAEHPQDDSRPLNQVTNHPSRESIRNLSPYLSIHKIGIWSFMIETAWF